MAVIKLIAIGGGFSIAQVRGAFTLELTDGSTGLPVVMPKKEVYAALYGARNEEARIMEAMTSNAWADA